MSICFIYLLCLFGFCEDVSEGERTRAAPRSSTREEVKDVNDVKNVVVEIDCSSRPPLFPHRLNAAAALSKPWESRYESTT